jgi:hypothetical protein
MRMEGEKWVEEFSNKTKICDSPFALAFLIQTYLTCGNLIEENFFRLNFLYKKDIHYKVTEHTKYAC